MLLTAHVIGFESIRKLVDPKTYNIDKYLVRQTLCIDCSLLHLMQLLFYCDNVFGDIEVMNTFVFHGVPYQLLFTMSVHCKYSGI